MPAFLLRWLIQLAIQLGFSWVVKKFPKLPEEFKKIIEDYLSKLADGVTKDEKKEVKKETIQKVRACRPGDIACPPDLKS